ncbi:MAG: ribosome assembly RNA-binding protein YhbY [Wenzhouxiangellaceae bacterium]|nr:ribosome assembly RNA-binding protein YhbY [Wenzhouxiangellaceae bacterium]
MTLTNAQIRKLRGLSHGLSPVVIVADRGLTDNVMAEIERALDHHELIKVKLRGERERRKEWLAEIVERTGAEAVQTIGQVASLYRRHPERPRIVVS